MKRIVFVAAALMLFSAATTMAGPGAPPGSAKAPDFPSCVAGTYLGEVALVGQPLSFQSLNTLGIDRTYVTESTIDFGGGGTVPNAFRTGGRGNWQAAGPHRLKTTYLHFAFDTTGALVWMEKVDATLTFDRGCMSAAGDASSSIYLPGQDPFQDAPVANATATVSMRRMPVD